MTELNKYSKKIIKKLEKYNNIISYKTYGKSEFIVKMTKEFEQTKSFELEKIRTVNIPKIHSKKEYPIIYIILKDNEEEIKRQFKYTPNFTNFEEFVDWHRTHHHLINVSKLDNYDEILYPENDRRILHDKIYQNNFLSLDIQQHVETEELEYTRYEGNNTIINLYTIMNGKKPNMEITTRIIAYMRRISGKTDLKLDLTVFYGNQRKTITNEQDVLSSNNINSGSTYPCRTMTIWREEEFYKVLIHELVHYVKFDLSHDDVAIKELNQVINKYIKVEGRDVVNEAYTEITAITLNTIVMSSLLKRSYDEFFNEELKYSLFQMSKIIEYYKGEKIEDVFKIIIKQTTSVRSYFIMKTFLLICYEEILEFWHKSGLTFNLDEESTERYVELYKRILEKMNKDEYDISYKKIINTMIKDIKEYKDKTFIYTTMRMSVIDII